MFLSLTSQLIDISIIYTPKRKHNRGVQFFEIQIGEEKMLRTTPKEIKDIKNCMIFVNKKKRGAAAYSAVLEKRLREERIEVFDYPFPSDLIVVVGGDGTMLRAIDCFHAHKNSLFMGINFGDKGFLMNDAKKDIVERILQKKLKISAFPLLEIESEGVKTYALNDVYVNRITGRNCHLKIKVVQDNIDEVLVEEKISGDGVIVSTALGSTAYNFAVGGPAVHPELPVTILSPINNHAPQLKPLALPLWCRIEIEILNSKGEVGAWKDGIDLPKLGAKIKVKAASSWVELAFWEGEDFTRRMIEKIMMIPK